MTLNGMCCSVANMHEICAAKNAIKPGNKKAPQNAGLLYYDRDLFPLYTATNVLGFLWLYLIGLTICQ